MNWHILLYIEKSHYLKIKLSYHEGNTMAKEQNSSGSPDHQLHIKQMFYQIILLMQSWTFTFWNKCLVLRVLQTAMQAICYSVEDRLVTNSMVCYNSVAIWCTLVRLLRTTTTTATNDNLLHWKMFTCNLASWGIKFQLKKISRTPIFQCLRQYIFWLSLLNKVEILQYAT